MRQCECKVACAEMSMLRHAIIKIIGCGRSGNKLAIDDQIAYFKSPRSLPFELSDQLRCRNEDRPPEPSSSEALV